MTWQPIETAPKDGRRFLALNHDGEIWVCRFSTDGRLCYRTNAMRESTVHVERELADGTRAWVRDEDKTKEGWHSSWTMWSRGYDFAPNLWIGIEEPPA